MPHLRRATSEVSNTEFEEVKDTATYGFRLFLLLILFVIFSYLDLSLLLFAAIAILFLADVGLPNKNTHPQDIHKDAKIPIHEGKIGSA